jgi:hypothetical protein
MLLHGKTTEVEPTVSEELIEFWEGQGQKYPSGRAIPVQTPNGIFFASGMSVSFARTGTVFASSGEKMLYDANTGVWRLEE